MYKNIFDSHAHYDDEQFDTDREQFLSGLPGKGIVGIINCGCDVKSSTQALKLADKFSFVYAACGIHPEQAEEMNDGDIDIIKNYVVSNDKAVAIGEIGLEYHFDIPKQLQRDLFEKQIILAKELDLPIIVHDREAHEDTLNILKRYKPRGVVHCFSGSVEMAKEILKLGMYIGIGGVATFKNAKKSLEVAKAVPEDRLLSETDCPYLAPEPFRGKRNSSDLIPYTAKKIAEIRLTTVQNILDITCNNAKTLFKI